jgi:hypothetical protein
LLDAPCMIAAVLDLFKAAHLESYPTRTRNSQLFRERAALGSAVRSAAPATAVLHAVVAIGRTISSTVGLIRSRGTNAHGVDCIPTGLYAKSAFQALQLLLQLDRLICTASVDTD